MSDIGMIWSKVDKTDNCWLWTGATSGGYPSVRWNGKGSTVARVLYRELYGDPPHNRFVRTTCGDKLCVRPEHLYLCYTTMDSVIGAERIARDLKRFWKYVDKSNPNGCWLWTGHNNGQYGLFFSQGRGTAASRAIYSLLHGPIDPGLVVRHKCDVTMCVNPDHLELGTHKDNVRDMYERGRAKTQKPDYKPWQHLHPELVTRGGSHHRSKLTDEQAKEIRSLYASGTMTQIEIGKKFGVSNSTVSLLVRGDRYNHAPALPDTSKNA